MVIVYYFSGNSQDIELHLRDSRGPRQHIRRAGNNTIKVTLQLLFKLENGQWNGVVGVLQRYEADLSVSVSETSPI
jgi:hypothetical protein